MSVALIMGGSDELAAWISANIGHTAVSLPPETITAEEARPLRGINPTELPDAIVFTAAIPVERSLTIAADVHQIRPDIDMILIAASEKEIMLDAMRVGIRDVAPSIEDPAFLNSLRDRLNARHDRSQPIPEPQQSPIPVDFTSRTITVVSPKGGVGKTSIASNLAVALAEQSPMDVVLVDLDLQFGDLSTVLDLQPTHTLEDAFGTSVRDNLLLKTYLTVHSSGFYVMCGADSPAATDKVTGKDIAALITQLQEQFRYVVIDTAAGLDEATLTAIEMSHDALIVSTMDVACLRSVRKEIELLNELAIMPPSRFVVVNFADKQSGLRIKDVEAVLGLPVDFVVPRTKDQPAASNRGVPLLVSTKNGPFVKTLRNLARRVYERAAEAEGKSGHRRLEVA